MRISVRYNFVIDMVFTIYEDACGDLVIEYRKGGLPILVPKRLAKFTESIHIGYI